MVQRVISDWQGAAGGSRDNYPELLSKTKSNFAEIYAGLHRSDSVSFFDDFLGDLLADEWAGSVGSGGAAAVAVAAAKGGVCRLTSDDTAATVAADGAQLSGELNWYAENGNLVFETRLKIDAITTVSVFAGLTDTKSLEAPVQSAASADTITTNATDAVGFMFDTSMATDNIWLVGVANNVDATAQNSGLALGVDTYIKLRVELTAAGVASFYINGVLKGTAMTGAVTPTVALCPVVLVWPRTTAVRIVDVDYVACSMTR